MNENPEKERNRREFFTDVLRYVTLGTIGVIGGAVFTKRRKLLKDGICINQGACAGCGIFERCNLPPALSKKQFIAELDNE
ncbi:MAG: hypothetical protein PVH77_12350 [Phycisphaerales bacterium]|jgi:hypothetical protein